MGHHIGMTVQFLCQGIGLTTSQITGCAPEISTWPEVPLDTWGHTLHLCRRMMQKRLRWGPDQHADIRCFDISWNLSLGCVPCQDKTWVLTMSRLTALRVTGIWLPTTSCRIEVITTIQFCLHLFRMVCLSYELIDDQVRKSLWEAHAAPTVQSDVSLPAFASPIKPLRLMRLLYTRCLRHFVKHVFLFPCAGP